MKPLNRKWIVAKKIPAEIDQVLIQFPPAFRQILFNRGCTTLQNALDYLSAAAPVGNSPGNLSGMDTAIDRIQYYIKKGKKIVIYGDYDVDGVTATTLLKQVLLSLGAFVESYIPNRFDEGYGLNNEAINNLNSSGTKMIITVDCGIRSVDEARLAKKLGIDLIITDHHHHGTDLPEATAIINPKLPGNNYPEKNLAGVGLAYKMACALLAGDHTNSKPADCSFLLDLVALGTIADLVPLTGENRALVRQGLLEIQKPRRQGLLSLIGVSGLKAEEITAHEVGFMLAPRLNAAGRLESALDALTLLSTSDVMEAGKLAQKLDLQNRERQALTQTIQETAIKQAFERDSNPYIMIAIDPSFNPGVVGLAASRITEQYYRPAIVAQKGDIFTRGSCRSITEFHITRALDEVEDLLEHHGGHSAAAGFTILNDRLEEFIFRMQSIAKRELEDFDLKPVVKADIEIELSELRPELLPYLQLLQPTGMGNPQALFVSRNLKVRNWKVIGRENNHLKLTLTDGKITYDAIAFQLANQVDILSKPVDIIYTFEKNVYYDRTYLQLNIKDIRPASMND